MPCGVLRLSRGCSAQQHPRRERMTQIVKSQVLNAGLVARLVEAPSHPRPAPQRVLPFTAGEQPLRALRAGELGLQKRQQLRMDRDEFRSVVLCPWDADQALLEIHLTAANPKDVATTQSRVPRQDDDQPVALDLGLGQVLPEGGGLVLGQVAISRRRLSQGLDLMCWVVFTEMVAHGSPNAPSEEFKPQVGCRGGRLGYPLRHPALNVTCCQRVDGVIAELIQDLSRVVDVGRSRAVLRGYVQV